MRPSLTLTSFGVAATLLALTFCTSVYFLEVQCRNVAASAADHNAALQIGNLLLRVKRQAAINGGASSLEKVPKLQKSKSNKSKQQTTTTSTSTSTTTERSAEDSDNENSSFDDYEDVVSETTTTKQQKPSSASEQPKKQSKVNKQQSSRKRKTTTTSTTTTSTTTEVAPADEAEESEEDDLIEDYNPEATRKALETGMQVSEPVSSKAKPSPAISNNKEEQQEKDKEKDSSSLSADNDEDGNNGDEVKSMQKADINQRKKSPLVSLPFIKAKNASICAPEAYLEFPRDPFGSKWRNRGLIVVHIAVVCYMFYALAIVCENYFMPSLEEFAQRLELSEDVAGATLMSAGSSAPELFTAILGVFIAKGDVGTGAIVGSAVFNILFVIGICAFVSTTSAQLAWWPVLRDSVYYTFTVLVLILFIYDERITIWESATMLALYGLYIYMMCHNDKLRAYVTAQLLANPITAKLIGSQASLDASDDVFAPKTNTANTMTSSSQANNEHGAFFAHQASNSLRNYQTASTDFDVTTPSQNNNDYYDGDYSARGYHASDKSGEDDNNAMYMSALLIIMRHKRLFRSKLRFQSAARYVIVTRQQKAKRQQQQQKKKRESFGEANYFGPEIETPAGGGAARGSQKACVSAGSKNQQERMAAYARAATVSSKNKFSFVGNEEIEFWNLPPSENQNYYLWLAKIPANYILHYTIPNCTLYPHLYLYTFFLSIVWTALFSYLMVWMVTLIGYTFGIPDSVMGFSFLAAGTSVPDCYSSIHAARNGMADMAVSNSIGSNVFDILVGLALPWFIQSALHPGVAATINSRGIVYSAILLFLSLIATIYLMNKYEWTLTPRLGFCMLITYLLFIVFATMLEFNLFGNVNPPPCPVLSGT